MYFLLQKLNLHDDSLHDRSITDNNNDDFINVSSKNLAEGIPHC